MRLRAISAAAALLVGRGHLEEMLAALPLGVWLIDPSGRILLHNPEAERIWGEVQWGGRETYQRYQAEWGDGLPLSDEEWPVVRTLATGEAVLGTRMIAIAPDGTRRPIVAWSVPIHGEDGEVRFVLALNQDVSADEAMRAEIAKAKRGLELVLASIPSMVIALDRHGLVQVWNQGAELGLGIAEAQALGRPMRDLPIPWDWPVVEAALPGMRVTARVRLDDVRLRNPGGRERVLAFTIVPLPDLGAGGCLWLGADITERRDLEARIRHRSNLEAIGSLSAGIAHEINTPMQFIGDNVRFLADACAAVNTTLSALRTACAQVPETHRVEIDRILRGSDLDYILREAPRAIEQSLDGIARISGIVQAMQEFAHPGQDEAVPTDINRAIRNTIALARPSWKSVCRLITDLAEDLPPVPVIPTGFNQTILNLVANAVQAVEDAGRGQQGAIRITTRRSNDEAVVEISDNGCGIPSAVRHRIFDPFFTTRPPGQGSGQGLAVVRLEVIERLGGNIEVDSRPGEGSTFRLRLPLRHVPPPQSPTGHA